MIGRRVLRVGSLAWAVVGLSVGLAALRTATADARLLFLTACIVGPAAAALAAASLENHRDRLAGLLLLVSVVTPTVFAWILNVPALIVGLGLLVAPSVVVGDRRGTSRS